MTARFYLPSEDPVWMQKIKPKIEEIVELLAEYSEPDRLTVLCLTLREMLRLAGLSNVTQLGVLEVVKEIVHEEAKTIAKEIAYQMLHGGKAE